MRTRYLIALLLTAGMFPTLLTAKHRGPGSPIDMPISLRAGEVKTAEFRTKNGPYDVIIRVKKSLPVRQIDCLMGIRFTEPDCGKPPAVVANWRLWSGGKLVTSGSSKAHDNGGGRGSDVVELFLGGFDGRKNMTYTLEVNFVSDGSALDVTDPHLVVQFSDYN